MADSSIVSRDYQRAARLAEIVSRGVLAVKRTSLGIPSLDADTTALQDALADVLRALVVALKDPDTDEASSRGAALRARSLLSSELIESIARMRSGDMAYFVEDVRRAADAVSHHEKVTDEAALTVLDQVAAAADAEASRVYRRMSRY